ncbi:hypothetical protein XENTR_v10020560 [Xenopus tropicalis]|nr:hypothetical protein XENTR_v10020560 [Xenopus tropicalis]
MPGMTFVNRISSLLGQCENAWWGSHTRKSTVTHSSETSGSFLCWFQVPASALYCEKEEIGRRRVRLEGVLWPLLQPPPHIHPNNLGQKTRKIQLPEKLRRGNDQTLDLHGATRSKVEPFERSLN